MKPKDELVISLSKDELINKLNHLLNDTLINKRDDYLLKLPDSNKIAIYINNWIEKIRL